MRSDPTTLVSGKQMTMTAERVNACPACSAQGLAKICWEQLSLFSQHDGGRWAITTCHSCGWQSPVSDRRSKGNLH